MRIIAGNLRGRRIAAPKGSPLRPISARIKKSLFDIIKAILPEARVLDLFAGSGAVGIEALSRGAKAAVFVDRDARCVETIESTLRQAGFAQRGQAHRGNVLEDLSWISYRCGLSQFDIIFLGPPYKDEGKRPLALSTPALARVAESRFLAPGGVVICQHHIKEKVVYPDGLVFFRREKYGDTILEFFRGVSA